MMMTGPHGLTFTVDQLLAQHTVTRIGGELVIRRDCLVTTSDGVRRVYGIDVELLDGAL